MSDFLAAMAVVKVNYDRRGHDVLQMLVPFVADCARRYTSPLSDQSIQEDLRKTFGLPVPRTVVKTLLRRLTRAGALERRSGVLIPVRSEIEKPDYDLSASIAEVRRQQAAFLGLGIAFAKRVFDVDVSSDDLSAALFKLARREVAPLASWAVLGGQVELETEVEVQLEQIAAQYVLHVVEQGSGDERSALEQIAKGSLLSGVLWTTDLDAPDRRIQGLELFLDTTLLLRLLGLCGPVRQAFSEELVDLATRSGISLVCFEHTRSEVVGVLTAAVGVVRSGRAKFFGEAVEYMVAEGWTASDVEEVIAGLDERLSDRGVVVRRRPDREARYNMDEAGLRDLLNQHVHYTNPAALDADVDSLASIFVLRRARHSDRLENSRAVFVTTNSNLALGSRQLYKIGEDGLRGVPLALIETQVASYLWARNPGSAESLSMNLLAVGALSIAESEPRVWLKYVEKLEDLRAREALAERDYVLLRQSLLARSILLSVTDNDPEAFTEDAADFVLKHALAEHARELQRDVQTRDVEIAAGVEQLKFSQARVKAQSDAFRHAARASAKRVVVIGGVLLGLLLLASSIASFPWPIEPALSTALPAWASLGLGVIAVGIGLASVLVGFTVQGFGEALMSRLTGFFERRYQRKFAPKADS